MQRSVSRAVHNVYIALSFTDETLDSAEMTLPAEVSGGVFIQLLISQQCEVVHILSTLHACQELIKLHTPYSRKFRLNLLAKLAKYQLW